ncbi:MAG: 30S ribosomal protein S18 [Deltaproteobacteria bacterium]|nr:30S ribosomal protein S18 [Deltaproteobacteria bacterium]
MRTSYPKSADKKRKKTYFKKKVCNFCVEKVENIDYKNPYSLKRFISERGKIMPRRISGVCSAHQRKLAIAIKRARQIALMPFSTTSST